MGLSEPRELRQLRDENGQLVADLSLIDIWRGRAPEKGCKASAPGRAGALNAGRLPGKRRASRVFLVLRSIFVGL